MLFWVHPRRENFAEFLPTLYESQNLGLNQTVTLFLMFPFDRVFFKFSMLNMVLNTDSWVVSLGLLHLFFSGLILFLCSWPGPLALYI